MQQPTAQSRPDATGPAGVPDPQALAGGVGVEVGNGGPRVAAAALPPTYELAIGELERLVALMEAGKLPLEELLQTYQRGADLLDFCRGRLDAVERQVMVLDDGRLKPWMPE